MIRPSPVLIVLHPDGYIEVFGEGINVKIVIAPDVPRDQEISAEDYVRNTLPRSHAELWFAGFCVATENLRSITVDDLVKRDSDMALIDVLNRIVIQREEGEKIICT